ncbi:MAG TPA: T9SS type A sorting domain-containing protein [Bacteroidia bacterium]|jgi:mono/diheme cytochrome c family protein|nr:T9SS type A sorting domain-containing protein [Bacteroidia bacterium]
MKRLLPFFILFALPFFAKAQAGPYWATDVAPILYANCTKCHNPNGIAPFPLITYNDAANNAAAMATAVGAGVMPPWPPDTTYMHYCGERKLSQAQIQTIVDWTANGMQQGNLAQAPTPPVYSGSAEITNPDLTLQMPNYTVNTGSDLYRCFVIPSGITQNEFITGIEVIPGNRPIVHHVLIYQDQSNTCVNLDNNDPGPGYTWFGDVGSSTATLVAGWVPGQGAYFLPNNMGIQLNANSKIIMQVHYPAGIVNQVDSTQVRFIFSSGNVRNVTLNPIINHYSSLTDGPLYIPADSVKTFHAQENVAFNATVISVAPHMHLIGRSMINFAITPVGDTIPLININDWNFHWQGFYNFQRPVHVPFGSVLKAVATYDNTFNNPWNPNNPLQDVQVGENTTDEMFIVYYAYLPYMPGDENIIVDSSLMAVPTPQNNIVKTPQLYDCYPSPAAENSNITIPYFLPDAADVRLEIYGLDGKLIAVPVDKKNVNPGFENETISTSGLAAGTYVVKLIAGSTVRTKQIVVQ